MTRQADSRGNESRPLVRIIAPHFVAGLEADEHGHVARTAPILNWMRGMTGAMVAGHCADRGWAWERVPARMTLERKETP